MKRKRCQKHGHRWIESVNGYYPPFQFCRRWFCKESRAAPWFELKVSRPR